MSILAPDRVAAVEACILALEEQEHERATRNQARVAWYEDGCPVYWDELDQYPPEED